MRRKLISEVYKVLRRTPDGKPVSSTVLERVA